MGQDDDGDELFAVMLWGLNCGVVVVVMGARGEVQGDSTRVESQCGRDGCDCIRCGSGSESCGCGVCCGWFGR